MRFKNILVLYKKSIYKTHFLEKGISMDMRGNPDVHDAIKRIKSAHNEHEQAVKTVEQTMQELGVQYIKCLRGAKIDFSLFDLIISVGGDGTFLEAAGKIKDQLIIGVNAAPSTSVGNLCVATMRNFRNVLMSLLLDKYMIIHLQRLRVESDALFAPFNVLNDILICQSNPADMSRYHLKIQGKEEDQRSSGVWISTAVGSTGAILSAGGKAIQREEKKMQYRPRELFSGIFGKYKLKGDILSLRQKIIVTSLMRKGMIYVDGPSHHYAFPFGSSIRVTASPDPIKTIKKM